MHSNVRGVNKHCSRAYVRYNHEPKTVGGVQKVMTAAALDENTTLVASGKQTTCGGVESQGIRSGGGTRVGCEGKAKIKWAGERYF